MDTFKKIYISIMVITVISIIVICAESIGVLTTNGDVTQNLYYLAGEILLYSILFALTANVIANKNNRVFGYASLFFELFCILLVIITLIADIGYSEAYYNVNKIISHISIVNILLLLIYCVPSTNSSHNKFQHLAAILAIVTYALYAITNNSSTSLLSTVTSYNSYYTTEEEESSDFVENLGTVLTYGVIGMMIVNPMLRVYYIDRDYSESEEIDEILTHSNDYRTNSKNISNQANAQPVATTVVQQAPAVPVQPEIVPVAAPQVIENPQFVQVEEKHEKVVNPNFKQEDLPEAVIPSITSDEPIKEETKVENVTTPPTPVTQTEQASTPQVAEVAPQATTPQEVAPTPQEVAPTTQESSNNTTDPNKQ